MRAFRPYSVIAAVFLTLVTAAAEAQDLLPPPPDLDLDELGELPRSLLAPNSGLGRPQAVTRGQAEEIGPAPDLEPLPEEPMMIFDPAEVWSSRSWLDRGYWYTVQEVVVTTRQFDNSDVILAEDFTGGGVPNLTLSGVSPIRSLRIRKGHPAAVANARITLGRFLFRDTENRDHLFEATFFGFGREQQRDDVASVGANGLATPGVLGDGNPAFDAFTKNAFGVPVAGVGSNSQAFVYTHEFESLEFNYRVRQRRDRDWMTLRPNGQWVREAAPTRLFEYLAGVRWVSADEWLEWDASGFRNGFMDIKANNDLLGVQLGVGASQALARWEFQLNGKAGVYGNFVRVNRNFSVRQQQDAAPDAVLTQDRTRAEEEDISFVGEFQSVLRYHIHTNFSLRFGYQLMYIDSMAVAPFQISFVPDDTRIGLSGSSFYQGFLLGIDGYW